MPDIPPGLKIIHSDPEFVVVDKPSGLLSVPGKGEDNQDCVVNRLKEMYPDCIDQPSVHRLDQDTSGLLVLALTAEAHRILSVQFMDRLVGKRYTALIDGEIKENAGVIELAFRLDPDNRPYQVYDPERGKKGTTRWRKLGVEGGKPVWSSCRLPEERISFDCTPPMKRGLVFPLSVIVFTVPALARGNSSCTPRPCVFVTRQPDSRWSFPPRRPFEMVFGHEIPKL